MAIFRNTIRQSRRERMRRIDRAFEKIFQTFFVCYFIFIFTAWLSERPSLQISSISVYGTQAVDHDLVYHVAESTLEKKILFRIKRNNQFLYAKRTMLATIKELSGRVKNVDIAVYKERELVVNVTEYVPALLWCPPETASTSTAPASPCYFADSEGHLFAPAPTYSGDPFLVFRTTPNEEHAILPKEEFEMINVFLKKLSDLEIVATQVRQSSLRDFVITADKPWEIHLSLEKDPEESVRNLALVLQNLNGDRAGTDQLQAIDLRFGNKVFYR